MADDQKGREQTFAEPEAEDVGDVACPTCEGTRLNATARAVLFGAGGEGGIGITQLARMSVTDIRIWFEGLPLVGREAEIARDLVPEIRSRLEFLEEVGLGYLTLDRGAPTLSGGEAQRIRLAAQLGSNLQGVCYVLDEPTIGLHARDNQILLDALHKLGEQGQHAGGGRARRGHHPPRRPHHRHRPQRRQARRPAGGGRLGRPTSKPRPIRRPAATCATRSGIRWRRGARCRRPSPARPTGSACAAPTCTTCRTSRSRCRCTGWWR